METELLLVYNADATLWATVSDLFIKTFHNDGYQCSLCNLTYGLVSMRRQWRRFLAGRPETVAEVHRDEFRRMYGAPPELPAIMVKQGEAVSVLVGHEEIDAAGSMEDLAKLVGERLTVLS